MWTQQNLENKVDTKMTERGWVQADPQASADINNIIQDRT